MFRLKGIRQQIIFAGVAFAAIALLFGMWSKHNIKPVNEPQQKELALKNGTAFPQPRPINPFELKEASTGGALTNEQLKGHWSLLFFGFTHCAMLCPTTLTTLNQAYKLLEQNNVKVLPNILFISIDPHRDSLKRIDTYVKAFNKNFAGATGNKEELDKLTKQLNILYLKVDPNKDDNYQIDHSGTVLLVDPEGHLAALFSPPLEPQILAQDYQSVIDNVKQAQ